MKKPVNHQDHNLEIHLKIFTQILEVMSIFIQIMEVFQTLKVVAI